MLNKGEVMVVWKGNLHIRLLFVYKLFNENKIVESTIWRLVNIFAIFRQDK